MDTKPNNESKEHKLAPAANDDIFYARGTKPLVSGNHVAQVPPDVQPERIQTDDAVIDLYGDFDPDTVVKTDKEIEELKALAQSDALRAYGFVRRKFAALRARIGHLKGAGRLFTTRSSVKLLTGFGLVVLLVGAGVYFIWLKPTNNTAGVMGIADSTGSFDVLTPEPSKQETVSGGTYDDELKVYSYQDKIKGNPVTVAQQPLPPEVANDSNGTEKLAISLSKNGLSDPINSAKGPGFIAQTANGGQILVVSYNQVLLFITSPQPLERQWWVDYINQLQ